MMSDWNIATVLIDNANFFRTLNLTLDICNLRIRIYCSTDAVCHEILNHRLTADSLHPMLKVSQKLFIVQVNSMNIKLPVSLMTILIEYACL